MLWDSNLNDTARREIFEEMNVVIDASAYRYPAVLIHETFSGRWLLSYLGVDISKRDARGIRPSGEGVPLKIPFKDLGKYLQMRKRWVPTGLLNVLAWLALEAIAVGPGPGFDKNTARQHLERWIEGAAKS